MADGFDATYVDTRRQLRGVAESLIAGPQYRASGTIRLAVRPNGFTGVSIPIAVHGIELVLRHGSVALDGPLSEIAAGLDSGPPDGVYDIVDPLPADAVLDLDAAAAEWIYRSHYAGGHAIKNVLPEQRTVLERAVRCRPTSRRPSGRPDPGRVPHRTCHEARLRLRRRVRVRT